MRTALLLMRRWGWIWAIHLFFILCMYHYFYMGMTPWKVATYRALGLSYERNYAAWWSGVCLALAALIYFRIAQLDEEKRTPWTILGAVALALFMDEIGSLHETVSLFGGWLGLLPFALILGAGFGWPLLRLMRYQEMRLPASLILLGVFIFAAVAGLEYVEHNVEANSYYQRLRLIVEESIELVAIGLLVMAGLIAYLNSSDCTQQHTDIRLSSLSAVIQLLFKNPMAMYLVFSAQITLVVFFVIPNFYLFPFVTGEGNITALYPVLLFLCLGLYCLNQGRSGKGILWTLLGYVLITTSLFQSFNFIRFLNGYFLTEWEWFLEPFTSWSAIFIPWSLTALFCFKYLHSPVKTVLNHLAILLVVMAFLSPGDDEIHYLFRLIDYHYFLFSSCAAFSCYHLMLEQYQSKKD